MSENKRLDNLVSRRSALRRIGLAGGLIALSTAGGVTGYDLLTRYVFKSYERQLSEYASPHGEDGDRIAYAVDYLAKLHGKNNVPAKTVSLVADYWNALDSDTKNIVGGQIPTPTAAVLADEILDPSTAGYLQEYPRLSFVHAHTNALLAIEPMMNITENDPRLVAISNARYTQGDVSPGLSYGVVSISQGEFVNKAQFVRDGLSYWASSFGARLNSSAPETIACTVNQTMAGDAIDQLGAIQYDNTGIKELMWFTPYAWDKFPALYAFSKTDRSFYNGDTNAFGLDTMNRIYQKLPDNIKYNWIDGTRTLQYFGDTGVAGLLRAWVKDNYGEPQMPRGPEDDYSFYKKLYGSQGFPAYTFEVLTPNFPIGNTTESVSSYFTVGSDGKNGISTLDDLKYSLDSDYLIDLQNSIASLEQYGLAGAVEYLRVFLPHQWHTGNLFKMLWKRS